MARKRHTSEQVVNLLRQVEVGTANGKTTVLACKETSIGVPGLFRTSCCDRNWFLKERKMSRGKKHT